MSRARHPDKDIEAALQFAEDRGWRLRMACGHAWGRMYCPYNDTDCRCGEFCIVSIWSTPRSGSHHARASRRVVENCSREQ